MIIWANSVTASSRPMPSDRNPLALGRFEDVDQFVIPVDGERAVRAEALHRERPGYADF